MTSRRTTVLAVSVKLPDDDSDNDVTMRQTITFIMFFGSHIIIFDVTLKSVTYLRNVMLNSHGRTCL